jgi:hypothetical protein
MANTKISALTSATTPLAGTEVLPIVQTGATVKVATDDLTVKNIRSNATTGILQVTGPAAASTRVMTTPNANFTVARTDAAQSFTGDQTLSTGNSVIGTSGKGITTGSAIPLGLGTNGSTTLVTVHNSGGVSIGNTTDPGATNLYITGKTNIGATGSSGKLTVSTDTTGTYYVADFIDTASGSTQYKSVRFIRGSTEVGSIQTTNAATAYVTSSDYRLKENVQPMSDGLQKILALNPVTYDWKSGGSGQGFIAHELQEIVSDCVTGSKDATEEEEYEITPAVKDKNGIEIAPPVMGIRTVPVYQGIDTSFLVATLVAAIKEQQTIINDLTNRVEILEKR